MAEQWGELSPMDVEDEDELSDLLQDLLEIRPVESCDYSESSSSPDVNELLRIHDISPTTRIEQPEVPSSSYSFDSSDSKSVIEISGESDWYESKNGKYTKTTYYCYVESSLFHEVPNHAAKKVLKRKIPCRPEIKPNWTEEEIEKINFFDTEDRLIDKQMKKESKEINHKRFLSYSDTDKNGFCDCGVIEHPSFWDYRLVDKIHQNLYRLSCKNLLIPEDIILSRLGDNVKIVKILMEKRNDWTEKVEQIIRYTDIEIGFYEGYLFQPKDRQAYLVLKEKKVICCAIVEPIKEAYRIITPFSENPKVGEKVQVQCGVNRVWVFLKYRRTKLGTTILDYVRHNCNFGISILKEADVAFANPNLLGRHFASSYCKSEDFCIY